MPQEEETPQYKTKVEDTDSALNRDVNNGQSDPVHVLKYNHLKIKNNSYKPVPLSANIILKQHCN